jgi:hypothetical protein
MGKGASTNKANVTKRPANYKSAAESTGLQGGRGVEPERKARPNACLVSFKDSIRINQDATDSIDVGAIFMIVPDESGSLTVVSSGRLIGKYTGGKSSLLRRCIKNGYIYRGTILGIETGSAQCEFTGLGVSNGTASVI